MANALEIDADGDVGDWRIGFVARLASALPATGAGAPAHAVGTPVYQSSLVKTSAGDLVGFTTPSAVALALHIAASASDQAAALAPRIMYRRIATPDGAGQAPDEASLPLMFDFFEQCMISAVFAYQAVEAFCNQLISRELRHELQVEIRGRKQVLPPPDLERRLSTEDKLTQVLPRIRSRPTPKGKAVWEPFRRLQTARDATVHLKARDQYTLDEDSLFYQFLSHRAAEFPHAAAALIRYFHAAGSEPRWLLRYLMINPLDREATR